MEFYQKPVISDPLQSPLVSIATITFNSEKFLRRTMNSVLSQSYQNLEYLIIDGGSTDKTLEIAQSFSDPRVKIFSEKDGGISDAMNKGIARAKGEWIGIIHSDDAYYPEAIERSVLELQRSKALWCYGKVQYLSFEGDPVYVAGVEYSLEKLKRFMIINHPSVFVSKKLYGELGAFDSEYRLAMDYDLCLRFGLKYLPVYIPHLIAQMRLGGASSKSQLAEKNASKEVLRIKLKHVPDQKFSAYFYFVWSILKISIRYFFQRFQIGQRLIPILRKWINPNISKAVS